jgi:hypothetical protein
MKAGGKQSNRLAGILDYIAGRKEMEKWTSVPTGSPGDSMKTPGSNMTTE